MSKAFAAVIGLLLLAASAAAQPKGPADVTVPVGRLAVVPLAIDGDESDYQVLGSDIDAFREYTTDPKQLRLRVIGYTPGVSYVVVASQKGGKLQPLYKVTVTVTGVGPPPVPPTPPVPPAPPLEPLAAKFAAAYKADGFVKYRDLAAGLDDCKALAGAAANGAEFFAAALPALKRAMGGDKIPPAVAAVLAAETEATLPKDSAAAWPAAKAVDLYKRLRDAALAAGGVQ